MSIIHREDFFARLQSYARLEKDINRVRELAAREVERIEAEWKGRLNAKRERIAGLLTKITQSVSS